MSPDEIIFAAEMWAEGASTKEIADCLALDESIVWNALDTIKAHKIAEAA